MLLSLFGLLERFLIIRLIALLPLDYSSTAAAAVAFFTCSYKNIPAATPSATGIIALTIPFTCSILKIFLDYTIRFFNIIHKYQNFILYFIFFFLTNTLLFYLLCLYLLVKYLQNTCHNLLRFSLL